MVIDDHGNKVLAQSRPAGTGAVSLYSPSTNHYAMFKYIVIANTTALAANASVFLHASGTTYDQTTALLYAKAIAANASEFIDFADGIEIADAANVGIQTGTGNALTFTLMGRVYGTL